MKKYNVKSLNITNYVPYIYNNKSKEWWKNNFNVNVRPGSDFEDVNNNSRFNLMLTSKDWISFIYIFSNYNRNIKKIASQIEKKFKF